MFLKLCNSQVLEITVFIKKGVDKQIVAFPSTRIHINRCLSINTAYQHVYVQHTQFQFHYFE